MTTTSTATETSAVDPPRATFKQYERNSPDKISTTLNTIEKARVNLNPFLSCSAVATGRAIIKNNVKTIFVEDMVSSTVSQTLAKQVGAKVEQIYTIESGEDNKTILSV